MKSIIKIFFLLSLLLFSCEKPAGEEGSGNPLIKFYGDAYSDTGESITLTPDGYAICGNLTLFERTINESGGREIVPGTEHRDLGVIFVDKKGNQLKKINIGNPGVDDTGRKIIAYDDYYLCVGTATREHNGTPDKDVIVTKINQGGIVENTWYYGDQYDQEGYDIIPNNSNTGFVVCGYSKIDKDGQPLLRLWEIDFNGNTIRTLPNYGWAKDDVAVCIISDNGSGYVIAATTFNIPGTDILATGDNLNLMVARFNNDFGPVDQVIYDRGADMMPEDLILMDDGGYLICGSAESDGNNRGFLMRVDTPISSGLEFTGTLYLTSSHFGSYRSITRLSDNTTFVIAGSWDATQGNLSSSENLFLFLDSDLNNLKEKFLSGGIGRQVVNDVVEDSSGNLVTAGTNGDEFRSLITLFKFDPWE